MLTKIVQIRPTALRQAIVDANANPGADIISFSIPGSGAKTILLSSLLPIITGSTIIDGYTQPTSVTGTVGARVITIAINAGSSIGRDGLIRFAASASTSSLSGLSIYNTGTSVEAIQIEPTALIFRYGGTILGYWRMAQVPQFRQIITAMMVFL